MAKDDFDKLIAGEKSMAGKLLEKHGPFALGCLLLGMAFWFMNNQFIGVMKEQIKDAKITAKENAHAATSIAESTEAIKDSVVKQEATMAAIHTEIEHQLELRKSAMEVMTNFADEVMIDHPEIEKKLDQILEKP